MTETRPIRDRILGVVLAGGQSRRMGGEDKALKPLAGRPMIAHVIERLAPQVGAMAINANDDPARFAGLSLPVFADTIGGHAGPLAGVLAAMRFAQSMETTPSHIATAATDTPFFPADIVTRLASEVTTADTIAMATSDGNRHPVFALWPVALADDLHGWLTTTDTFKVMAWVRRHRLVEVDFDMLADGGDPFFNVNTPADLADAEARLAAEPVG